jgi:hypothetical protein
MRFSAQKWEVIFNFLGNFRKISEILPRFSDFFGGFHQFFKRQKSGKTIREFAPLRREDTKLARFVRSGQLGVRSNKS